MIVWNKLFCLLGFSLLGSLSVNLRREHRNSTLVASSLVEVNNTVGQSIQCIVLALCNILTGEVLVTTLANNDVAGNDFLATPDLNA